MQEHPAPSAAMDWTVAVLETDRENPTPLGRGSCPTLPDAWAAAQEAFRLALAGRNAREEYRITVHGVAAILWPQVDTGGLVDIEASSSALAGLADVHTATDAP